MPSAPPPKDYGATVADDVEKAGEPSPTPAPSSSIRRAIDTKRTGKVPLSDFVWHQHSVFGMTVPDDHVAPSVPSTVCSCCDVDPSGLTRRRRIFLFLLVFFASSTLAVQVGDGKHGKFYALCAMVFLVLPLVCHLKEHLPTYSRFFMDHGVGPFGEGPGGREGLRIEELVLMVLFVGAPIKLLHDHPADGGKILDNVIWVWLGTIAAETVWLVFLYYCGKYCCCCFNCCVPSVGAYRVHRDEEEEGDDAEEGGKHAAQVY